MKRLIGLCIGLAIALCVCIALQPRGGAATAGLPGAARGRWHRRPRSPRRPMARPTFPAPRSPYPCAERTPLAGEAFGLESSSRRHTGQGAVATGQGRAAQGRLDRDGRVRREPVRRHSKTGARARRLGPLSTSTNRSDIRLELVEVAASKLNLKMSAPSRETQKRSPLHPATFRTFLPARAPLFGPAEKFTGADACATTRQ